MKVKKLFETEKLPYHMIVEMPDGKYNMFRIIPAREITESDLSPAKFWFPRGNQSKEAASYMYNIYHLEKV